MQRGGGLVEAGDGAARAQLDDLVGDVPQLEALQQVYVGRVPVLLGTQHTATLRAAPLAAARLTRSRRRLVQLVAIWVGDG